MMAWVGRVWLNFFFVFVFFLFVCVCVCALVNYQLILLGGETFYRGEGGNPRFPTPLYETLLTYVRTYI